MQPIMDEFQGLLMHPTLLMGDQINRGGHKYAGADVVCYESYTSTSSIMPNLCVMPAASQIYN